MWWWIGGGVVVVFVILLTLGMCKVADQADRDMGLK